MTLSAQGYQNFGNFMITLRLAAVMRTNYSPLVLRVYDVAAGFLVRFDRDESVTIVTIEIGEGHRSINYKGILPQALRPFREPDVGSII